MIASRQLRKLNNVSNIVQKSFSSYAASAVNQKVGNDSVLIKNIMNEKMTSESFKRVKGVHIEAISDFFASKSDSDVAKKPIIYSLSNIGNVLGLRREVRMLMSSLAPKLHTIGSSVTADELVDAAHGLNTMLSSDNETSTILTAMSSLVHANLNLNGSQFSEIVSCMHQLSSKCPETISFLKALIKQLDSNAVMTPVEVANCMYGLHNMSADDDEAITELLGLVTKQLQSSAATIDIVSIGRSIYGLASTVESSSNQEVVTKLLNTLSEKIATASTENIRDSCSGISLTLSGLQSLIHSNSSSVYPLLGQLNEFIKKHVNSSENKNALALTPKEISSILYSLKSFGAWNQCDMNPVIDLISDSLHALHKSNNRLLVSYDSNDKMGVTATAKGVKSIAHLLECLNIILINNVTRSPRKNPHKGSFASSFVPDTFATLPSKLPDSLLKTLIKSESILQNFMTTNHVCKNGIPYAVTLPVEVDIASEFVNVLQETKAKPKVLHNVYLHGTSCDIVIHGNFDYIFNIECDDVNYSNKLNMYPLAKTFEEFRDISLRYHDVRIIRVANKMFKEELTDATDRMCHVRDLLFSCVEDDIVEREYTSIDDNSINEAILKNIEEKKAEWAKGGGIAAPSKPVKKQATGGFKPSGRK